MELFVAEIYDYFYEVPMMVGVYMTEIQAADAIDIVINRVRQKDPRRAPDSRFVPMITPVQLNGFTPAVMSWLGEE